MLPRDQIRQRPGMYVGETGSSGVSHLVLEVISNGVDQYLQGAARQVCVSIDGDRFSVEDDGTGFPRDKAKHVLTHTHYSATADNHAPHIHLSPAGVGICPVNSLCESFIIESVDEEGGFRLRYREGELEEEAPVSRNRGTLVQGVVDRSIFRATIPTGALRRKCFDAVHLLPGLKISFNEETFHAPDGLLALADFEGASAPWPRRRSIETHRFGYNYDGEALSFTMACLGIAEAEPEVLSWVNGVRTPLNGSHVDGALDALHEIDWMPSVVTLSVVMKMPRYAGPTKDELAVEAVRVEIREALRIPLGQKRESLERDFKISASPRGDGRLETVTDPTRFGKDQGRQG